MLSRFLTEVFTDNMLSPSRHPPGQIKKGRSHSLFLTGEPSPPSAPGYTNKKSARRDSNPRPQPWQGCALPLSYSRIIFKGIIVSTLLKKIKSKIQEYNKKLSFYYIIPAAQI